MEIILVSKTRGSIGRLGVSWIGLITSVLLLLSVGAWLAFSGYRQGIDEMSLLLEEQTKLDADSIYAELADQDQRIEKALEDAHMDVNALAMRVGHLQALQTRVEALGTRLVEKTQLPVSEFDFSLPVALGGFRDEMTEQEDTDVHDFISELELLSYQMEDRAQLLQIIESLLIDQQQQENSTPEGKPVEVGYISSGFGPRVDPKTGKKDFHRGLDFAGKNGSNVLSVASGVVTYSARRQGYGNIIEIEHGDGFITRYAHNQKNMVLVGDVVQKGQTIALLGSTGRSTGPHVHFEVVKDGKIVNPKQFVKNRK